MNQAVFGFDGFARFFRRFRNGGRRSLNAGFSRFDCRLLPDGDWRRVSGAWRLPWDIRFLGLDGRCLRLFYPWRDRSGVLPFGGGFRAALPKRLSVFRRCWMWPELAGRALLSGIRLFRLNGHTLRPGRFRKSGVRSFTDSEIFGRRFLNLNVRFLHFDGRPSRLRNFRACGIRRSGAFGNLRRPFFNRRPRLRHGVRRFPQGIRFFCPDGRGVACP